MLHSGLDTEAKALDEIPMAVTLNGGAKYRWRRKNWQFSTNICYNQEMVQDRNIVKMEG